MECTRHANILTEVVAPHTSVCLTVRQRVTNMWSKYTGSCYEHLVTDWWGRELKTCTPSLYIIIRVRRVLIPLHIGGYHSCVAPIKKQKKKKKTNNKKIKIKLGFLPFFRKP
jgi:hypothetical protein